MAVYSCNYPVWHSFDATDNQQITYYIYIGNTQIYTGQVLPYDTSSTTLQIDISEICNEYLDTFYENIEVNGITSGQLASNGLISSIVTFTVRSDSNAGDVVGEDVSYNIAYDYNTDYTNIIGDKRLLNDPIDNKVDPRQILFITGYNIVDATQQYTYQIGQTSDSISITSGENTKFQYVGIPLSEEVLTKGTQITLTMDGFDPYSYIVTEPCKNKYVLYYVNKFGGFDSLLMSGKQIESWNPDTTSVRLYNDRGNRRDWEQKKIHIDIDHLFELNTGLLTNEGAAKIDHLIYSPKVLLHDLDKDTITTVLIDNTNYSVKQRNYDIPQYTITVKESQKQIRR